MVHKFSVPAANSSTTNWLVALLLRCLRIQRAQTALLIIIKSPTRALQLVQGNPQGEKGTKAEVVDEGTKAEGFDRPKSH